MVHPVEVTDAQNSLENGGSQALICGSDGTFDIGVRVITKLGIRFQLVESNRCRIPQTSTNGVVNDLSDLRQNGLL